MIALAVNVWTPIQLSVPAVALACAAGVLAVTQNAPMWAAIFVWELARPPWWLLVVFAAAALTTITSRGALLLRPEKSGEGPVCDRRVSLFFVWSGVGVVLMR